MARPPLRAPLVYRSLRLRRMEAMDDPGLDPALRETALRGLESIAAWPGQRRPILETLLRWTGGLPERGRTLRVVELGAGSGHLSRWLAGEMAARGIRAEWIPTDARPQPGVAALEMADEKAYPDADIFLSNLVWHHLPDEVLCASVRAMEARARIGWMAYDLHRHWLHYYGARLALGRLPAILRFDGALSIQQGYRREELERLLARAGCGEAEIRWCFPFRWLVRRVKGERP